MTVCGFTGCFKISRAILHRLVNYLTDLEANKIYLPPPSKKREAHRTYLSLILSRQLPRGTEINHADVMK
jgi:hypothetical protein